MKKSTAIDLINKRATEWTLNNKNTVFSNINAAADVWWVEPANEKFKSDLHVILYNQTEKEFYHFYLPANTILEPEKIFDQQTEKNSSKWMIPVQGQQFVDRSSGFDLTKYRALKQ